MADKMKKGITVRTTFVDGETPTGAKLNSITAQLEYALSEVEFAIGDIHDESHPYSSSATSHLSQAYGKRNTSNTAVVGAATRPLDIANLARIIGPASNLNPYILTEAGNITEVVPTGVHQFSLEYPVDGDVSLITFSDASVFATLVAVGQVSAAGQYSVSQDGIVSCYTVTTGGTVTYAINPQEWGSGTNHQGGRFNVIPDPNQITAGGSGLSASAPDSQGRITFTLPTVSHQQWTKAGSSSTLTNEDPNYTKQLKLPEVITENYSAGERIPQGFLYLKNVATGEFYENATYDYISETSIRVGEADLTDAIARADDFVIVTVGTNLTSAVDDLRRKARHSHDRSWGEPFIEAASISGWTTDAGNSGQFGPSEIPGNYAPQYLHRDGYQGSGIDHNVNDKNAMRGPLLMGLFVDGLAVSPDPGEFTGIGISQKLLFCDEGGPSIKGDNANLFGPTNKQRLVVENAAILADDGICHTVSEYALTPVVKTITKNSGTASTLNGTNNAYSADNMNFYTFLFSNQDLGVNAAGNLFGKTIIKVDVQIAITGVWYESSPFLGMSKALSASSNSTDGFTRLTVGVYDASLVSLSPSTNYNFRIIMWVA